MTAWVLMAWDGPSQYAESWEPIHVFDHEPSLMERGRALVHAHRRGALPWDGVRGDNGDRWLFGGPIRITDLTDVREVPRHA